MKAVVEFCEVWGVRAPFFICVRTRMQHRCALKGCDHYQLCGHLGCREQVRDSLMDVFCPEHGEPDVRGAKRKQIGELTMAREVTYYLQPKEPFLAAYLLTICLPKHSQRITSTVSLSEAALDLEEYQRFGTLPVDVSEDDSADDEESNDESPPSTDLGPKKIYIDPDEISMPARGPPTDRARASPAKSSLPSKKSERKKRKLRLAPNLAVLAELLINCLGLKVDQIIFSALCWAIRGQKVTAGILDSAMRYLEKSGLGNKVGRGFTPGCSLPKYEVRMIRPPLPYSVGSQKQALVWVQEKKLLALKWLASDEGWRVIAYSAMANEVKQRVVAILVEYPEKQKKESEMASNENRSRLPAENSEPMILQSFWLVGCSKVFAWLRIRGQEITTVTAEMVVMAIRNDPKSGSISASNILYNLHKRGIIAKSSSGRKGKPAHYRIIKDVCLREKIRRHLVPPGAGNTHKEWLAWLSRRIEKAKDLLESYELTKQGRDQLERDMLKETEPESASEPKPPKDEGGDTGDDLPPSLPENNDENDSEAIELHPNKVLADEFPPDARDLSAEVEDVVGTDVSETPTSDPSANSSARLEKMFSASIMSEDYQRLIVALDKFVKRVWRELLTEKFPTPETLATLQGEQSDSMIFRILESMIGSSRISPEAVYLLESLRLDYYHAKSRVNLYQEKQN
ncbi:hypothetical protein ACFL0Z_00095 [Patescibacteria group bacterium]